MRGGWVLAALVTLAGCGVDTVEPEPPACDTELAWGLGGPAMLPGTDCLRCHRDGGRAERVFTVGGTVFAARECPKPLGEDSAVRVHVEDAEGTTLSLKTNEVGNFFSIQPLGGPLRVAVQSGETRVEMLGLSPSGDCGACHVSGSILGLVATP